MAASNVLDDPWVAEAVRRFSKDYASVIADRKVEILGKDKSVLKFGRNLNMSLGVLSTIWDVGVANETYLDSANGTSANLIDRISASNASDTSRTIRVEGHYLSAAHTFHFVALDVVTDASNGQTPVDLANATVVADAFGGWGDYLKLARCSRLANLSATDLLGNIYAFQSGITVTAGVPQDLTKTHAKITSPRQQTNKCATTISNEDFAIMTTARAGVGRAAAAFVDFSLEIAERPNIFRERTLGIASRDSGFVPFFSQPPYIVIPPNSDIRLLGSSSANSVTGLGEFNLLLGKLT